MAAEIKTYASKVLFALSTNNFNAVFSRISARLQELSNNAEENPDFSDIELMQHINVDVGRLVKLLNEINMKFKNLRKNAQIVVMTSLERAIWSWMDTYPSEFSDLQKSRNEELSKCSEGVFEHLDGFADNSKKRAQAWPLQIMLIVLSPKVLEEIIIADNGAPVSQRNIKKKQFIDQLKRSLVHSTGKLLTETAAITCVKLCKIATYVNTSESNNVVIILANSILNDLKTLLFNPAKPFFRGQVFTSQDIELMIDCFVSLFRINPHHHSEALKVCLHTNSPPQYHFCLVSSLYRCVANRICIFNLFYYLNL